MVKDDRPAFIRTSGKIKGLKVTDNKAIGDADFIRNEGEITNAHIARNQHIVPTTKQTKKSWYEKPLGIITLAVISGLVIYLLTHLLS